MKKQNQFYKKISIPLAHYVRGVFFYIYFLCMSGHESLSFVANKNLGLKRVFVIKKDSVGLGWRNESDGVFSLENGWVVIE
ncbi:hypothetical protein SANA_20400 [Gottschalkiaceae bacterium SANA]|nr:hypothetical protein SANA_20400 [Gottschalkiaceae bacterium SANA]